MSLREQARAVVALHVAAEGIRRSIEEIHSWEDFPDIGENDWNHIVAEAILISANSRPDQDELDDALKLLYADRYEEESE